MLVGAERCYFILLECCFQQPVYFVVVDVIKQKFLPVYRDVQLVVEGDADRCMPCFRLDLLFYLMQDGGFRRFGFIAGVQFGDNVGLTRHKQFFEYRFGR